jgi:hypothetical protein
VFILQIRLNPLEGSDVSLLLRVHLPEDYPSSSAPVAELEAPWLTPQMRDRVWEGMAHVHAEEPGEPVLFRWTEWIKVRAVQIRASQSRQIPAP